MPSQYSRPGPACQHCGYWSNVDSFRTEFDHVVVLIYAVATVSFSDCFQNELILWFAKLKEV